ncbi:hypothetical protein FFLO_07101 [Filobasidium floriforme]|uniref:Methyltransferase domain-containing protein n=1 Tax=Filobasidium floriforme TaxID=5210 RepID=A0A8K0NLH4_9TREE|nr:uncharacterized protein HD553DRAFT_45097 [Filobasidium floriforme]KAG7527271.1 hypothetical protein FFLO_07101 [Filobasidium floriforme]KAH8084286.1 hypothetical protein HD553DRAFT_45097 [Filobasidium floriforme]
MGSRCNLNDMDANGAKDHSSVQPSLSWREFQFQHKAQVSKHPAYPRILQMGLLDDTAFHLDVGCSTGTDLRKLAGDGWSAERLIGVDLEQAWIDLGYKQYRDRATCDIKFVAGDICHDDLLQPIGQLARDGSNILDKTASDDLVHSNVRCISVFSFFHLFDEAGQLELARRLGSLLSNKPGSTIYGAHRGRATAGRAEKTRIGDIYCHSPSSWTSLWQERVFPESSGISVQVDVDFRDGPEDKDIDRVMVWSVTIA